MNIRDILPAPAEEQEAFILDHGKTVDDGSLKYQDDMTSMVGVLSVSTNFIQELTY